MIEADVAVIGGGPAGSVAALRLARAGQRVAVLHEHAPAPPVGDHLPGEARPLLDALGLQPLLGHTGALRSSGVTSAWGEPELHAKPGVFSPYGAGWHLDRSRFDAALRDEARAAGALVLQPARVHQLRGGAGRWALQIRGCDALVRARWLIDATGRTAWLGRAMGSAPIVVDRLYGFVAIARGRLPPFALVEARPQGWFYSAPLPSDRAGERAVVMFLTDAERGASRWWPRWWQGSRTASRFEGFPLGPIRAYRATSQWSPLSTVAGWLPVGDAALARDPLSSKGLLSALRSGLDAAGALLRTTTDPSAVLGYLAQLGTAFDDYRRRRAEVYRAEHRFVDRPFWSSRRGAPPIAPV